ncbi:lysozyme g-like [Clupea harengus]|uniref:Lysozyme g n=1 Tax=Clupea harengus TaxID=7950 RepID=A0A6P8GAF3_CLUHA|nr:lysozyme g-like [Clupea harengus]
MSTYAQEAKEDLPHINKYKDKIISAANNCNVPPSVVAGIISRETRGGRGAGFTSDGWGDNRNAFGLMQVDIRYHMPQGAWDSQTHIEQGIGILQYFLTDFKDKRPSWSAAQQLKGALAAYNMGTERMDYNNVDAHTTGGDYSADVLARAEFFKRNGY